jgi:hypothetical protein
MADWVWCGLMAALVVGPAVPGALAAQEDRVAGMLVADGDTLPLRHVLARKVPNLFDRSQIVTQVLPTTGPVPEAALEDAFALSAAVREGDVAGVRLEDEPDGRSVTATCCRRRWAGRR